MRDYAPRVAKWAPVKRDWIGPSQVDRILTEAVPDFAGEVLRHRSDHPDEPMLYLLAGRLFEFVTAGYRRPAPLPPERMAVARQIYDVVERLVVEGDTSVSDPFTIEMIEPLALDRNFLCPDLTPVMGRITLQRFLKIRESPE